MRECSQPLVGVCLVLASSLVWGQGSVPVIDRSGSGGGVSVQQTPPAPPNNRPAQVAPQTNPMVGILMTVDQLQEEVRFLRGQIEEQGHEIKQMRRDQRDRYRDLDRRIGLLTQRLSESPPAAQTSLAPLPTPGVSLASPEAPVSISGGGGISDEQAFRLAFAHVRQQEFDQALAAFADFERTHATSELLGNVYYWTGEVHRAKPEPDQQQAQLAYQRLLERFPAHAKAPEATYKLGLTHDAQGNRDKALEMMQAVISRYPEQQPARLARDFLTKN